ncbi:hypothetical protein [Paenibacillus thermotolerans]|uniref:hypothetical protein n=1 Tax=Paenibacillus thermotolerans TaxID=3027807 RepID=UPI002368DC5E|nr:MULTISPECIES: hypothetical protein [unclassified Paenibacillus]
MAIIVGTIATWIAVTVFSLIPKKLTVSENIVLFFYNTIFELSVFTILHVNLKLIVVEPGIGNGIADLMFRLIELPLVLVATSNILLYSSDVKWLGVALIVLFTLLVQLVAVYVGIVSFHHWNIIYSAISMCANVLFSRIITWAITSLDRKVTA